MVMAAIDLEAMQSLVNTMNTAASDLRGKKTDLAGTLGGVDLDTSPPQPLEQAAGWVEQQVPGLRRRLALAQQIAATDPKFASGQAVSINENELSRLPPGEAQKKATAAAAALKAAGGQPSPELVKEISENQNDPYYAAAFAKSLTPDELAKIVKESSFRMGRSMGSPQNDNTKTMEERYKQLIHGMAGTLGTATRSTGADLRLSSDYGKKFAAAITQDGQDSHDELSSKGGTGLALSLLVKNGTFSTPFLNTVATDVYAYERKHEDDHPWDSNSGGYWFPKDPDWDYKSRANIDVMANVLKGLGRDGKASQLFFSQGGQTTVKIHGNDVPVNSRLKYLLQDRGWSNGDMGSDSGDGLGDAIKAASVDFRNQDDSGAIGSGSLSATVASQTMALVGDKDGDGAHGGRWYKFGGGSSSGWHMPGGLKHDMAEVLASYVPDLYRVYHNSDRPSDDMPPWIQTSNSQGVDGDPIGMSLNHDDLKKILQSLGSDSGDINTISTSVLAYNQYQTSHLLSEISDPQTKAKILMGKDWPPLTAAMKTGPGVLSNILGDAYTGDDREEKIKNANTEALNKFIDIAGDFPVVKIANPVAGWAFDTVKGQVLDHLKGEPVDEAAKLWTDDANKQTQALTHNFQNVMLRNGFYDPKVISILQKNAGTDGGYNGPPPGALRYQDGKPVGFDFQSTAYDDWANGLYDKDTAKTNGTMPGGQLSEEIKQIYVTNFGVKF